MSIPGFGGTNGSLASDSSEFTQVSIPPANEWRIEVPFKKLLKLKVTLGTLEINGSELPNNVELQLSGVKLPIYAPPSINKEHAKVEYKLVTNPDQSVLLSSEDEEFTQYLSDETNMDLVVNLAMYIESKRQIAKDLKTNEGDLALGPRVLILGGKYLGKTSLAKTLVSYAVKMGSSPVLVNLDPKHGVFALPGSLSATVINDSLDIECANGYGFTMTTTGSLSKSMKQPVVKNFGFSDVDENVKLYTRQIDQLGIAVLSKLEGIEDGSGSEVDGNHNKVRSSGVIVDTPPFTMKSFDIISSIVSDLKIDLIVVLGNEKMKIDLTQKLKHKIEQGSLNIIKLSKSPGVVDDVNDRFIRMTQEQTIREYFNGNHRIRLSPFKTEIDLPSSLSSASASASSSSSSSTSSSGLVIYKSVLTKEYESSMAFLPSGDDFEHITNEDENGGEGNDGDGRGIVEDIKEYYQILEDPNSSNLDNSIVAITHLPLESGSSSVTSGPSGSLNMSSKRKRELLNTSVMGYIHVSKVDDEKKKMKILLPFPGVFPRNVLIATSIGYNE